MIGTRANKWQAERDIHTFMKRMQLERDQPLVVIHAKNSVKIPLHRPVKKRIRRQRPDKVPHLT